MSDVSSEVPQISKIDFQSEQQRWVLQGRHFNQEGVLYDVYTESGRLAGLYDVKFRSVASITLKPYGNFKLVEGVFYTMKYRTVTQQTPHDIMDFVLRDGTVHVDFKLNKVN